MTNTATSTRHLLQSVNAGRRTIPESTTTALETEDGRHAEKLRRAADLVVIDETTDGDYTCRLLAIVDDR